MNWNERLDVSPEKVRALRERVERLGIDLGAVEERFVRGGGPGGQKMQKASNAVQLRYPPLGLDVRCHRDRRRTVNRFLALRELVDRIEMKLSPQTSERLKAMDKVRRQKARRLRKASRKYGPGGQPETGGREV